ncbi:hypothetical protein BX666DRAFT_1856189 [Dichotomocladium elegans]|nr:hypothetical protein BX666DRAFT_1856189 [Dichotomocladium elegans]
MGTPIDSLRKAIAANDSHQADPSGFDLWFTWCQTCRHGGHAVHIFDWFRNHTSCPVSSCNCHCYNLSPDGKTGVVPKPDGGAALETFRQ